MNEITNGGKLISVIDGALEVRDCIFTGNFIYIDTLGIYIT
jgi:hypothetical protein